jgi:hypothetical protein
MAVLTLLQIVNQAMTAIGSEKVTAITDTDEAIDIAQIAERVYYIIMANEDWPHLKNIVNLTTAAATATPTQMSIPATIMEIDHDTLYYDKREAVADDPLWQLVTWVEPEEFLWKTMPRSANLSETNIIEVTAPKKLYLYNDRAPAFCTSFDDETVIFDSYDVDVETYLATAKSQVIGYTEPTFTQSSSFTPDMPAKNFPQYLEEVISTCAAEINQEVDPKAERNSRMLDTRLSRRKGRTRRGIRFTADYGRK